MLLILTARAYSQTYYVALGDSLAAGYQPLPGGGSEIHHGYAEDLAPKVNMTLVNLGCPGETSATMINGGECNTYTSGSQLGDAEAFLAANAGKVGLVTIDIGVNDVLSCVTNGSINASCLVQKEAQVETNLQNILTAMRNAGGSNLKIIAMNYYDPFLAEWLNGTSGQLEAVATVAAVEEFNAAEAGIYLLNAAPVADVANAFQTLNVTPVLYNGQLVPKDVVEICQNTWMCSLNNIHANDAGYQLIANTIYPLTQ
ncbi:MAG TPA: SGNH/GDSL hydrolase family protein [Pseudacidobacterium sp.]|jgi:lysophospholipase L1-like esterase|nr:SGNH/GDSL hydrolase family protein [Pseudacidobacterium sp.]